MLRAKIYVNIDELEDIQIVNMKIRNKRGATKYRVDTLEDSFTIYHNRGDGWIKLLLRVLYKMQRRLVKYDGDTITFRDSSKYDELISELMRNCCKD